MAGHWNPSTQELDCYYVYRQRIESEDRWIVARLQIVTLSQGFLFAGLSAMAGGGLVANVPDTDACVATMAVALIGFITCLFGMHGVTAAVLEIDCLSKSYLKAAKDFGGENRLPDIISDPENRHTPVNNRAIWFMVMMASAWLGIGLFAFHQI